MATLAGPLRRTADQCPRAPFVDATSVVYGKRTKPKPLALFEIVKGIVTGSEPDVADIRRISGRELEGPHA